MDQQSTNSNDDIRILAERVEYLEIDQDGNSRLVVKHDGIECPAGSSSLDQQYQQQHDLPPQDPQQPALKNIPQWVEPIDPSSGESPIQFLDDDFHSRFDFNR